MKKLITLIFLIVLLISTASCKEKKVWTKDDPLIIEDFYLTRVKDNFVFKTNLHISDLDKDLKSADKTEIKQDKDYPEYKTRFYFFDGLTIESTDSPEPYCDDNFFTVTNTKYMTNRGIKVGDSKENVLSKYMIPEGQNTNTEELWFEQRFEEFYGSFYLVFKFDKDNLIKEIYIEFRQVCL